jgi:hypothetical protein
VFIFCRPLQWGLAPSLLLYHRKLRILYMMYVLDLFLALIHGLSPISVVPSFSTPVSTPTPLRRNHPDRAIQWVWQTPSPTRSIIVLVPLGQAWKAETGGGQRCMRCTLTIIAKPRNRGPNTTSPLNLIARLWVLMPVHIFSTSRPPCEGLQF